MSLAIPVQKLTRLQETRWQLTIAFGYLVLWCLVRMIGLPLVPYGLLIPLVAIAATTDLSERRIPNWLTYATCWMGMIAALAVTMGGVEPSVLMSGRAWFPALTIRTSLSGFAASFGIMSVLFCMGAVKAGDVKLAGAIGACLGVKLGINVILWAHLVSGVVALCIVLWRIGPNWMVGQIFSRVFPAYVQRPVDDHSETLDYPIPMAVFFAIGTCLTLMEFSLL